MRKSIVALALAFGVGCGNSDDDAATTHTAGGSGGSGGSGSGGSAGLDAGPPVTTESFFDPCGGKIVDPDTGAVDPVEYAVQARAWDLATIDCRLGPKFTDAYPGQDDPRPTMFAPPENDVPVSSSAHLDAYQIGDYFDNGESYGVGIAQVLFVPASEQDVGVDRIYVLDWRDNMISESPERQPGGADSGHPDQAVSVVAWADALGHSVRHPIVAARSPLGQSANAMILFQDGLIGAAPWSDTFFKFPDTIVPTSA